MKLYHGTYNEKIADILREGVLDNFKVDETTKEIDELIEKCIGLNLTENALYLTNDIECTQCAYDYEFTLEVGKDLDPNYLFVADNMSRDEILCYYDDGEVGKDAVNRYRESFISYDEYLKVKEEYDEKYFPEFLYFKEVDITNHKEEAINHLKEEELYDEELGIFLA